MKFAFYTCLETLFHALKKQKNFYYFSFEIQKHIAKLSFPQSFRDLFKIFCRCVSLENLVWKFTAATGSFDVLLSPHMHMVTYFGF